MDKKRASSSVEEEAGVLKSGYVTAAFSPVNDFQKTKKVYYAVLGHRALELHESEKKSQRKNRHPRHLIDLSTCFNINRHFDGRLKYCVAIMTPDETLVLRAETDVLSDEWYDMLMSAVIPARALHLGRPVLANEFFECAWDVTMVEHPKFRKPVKSSDKLVNLCTKDPSLLGPHRLCFYHHTIILCRRGIEPASSDALSQSGIPPFKGSDFVEFPRQYMASFGCQERYFFMVMGRSSPSGSGELWAQCDCEEVAADVHSKLNKIIEEECEKKKKMPNGPLLHLTSTYQAYRDRLHTHSGIRRTGTAASRKLTPDELSLKERRAQLRGYKWAADSIQERTQEGSLSPNVPSFLWFDSTTAREKCLKTPRSGPNSLARRIDRTRSFEAKMSLTSSCAASRVESEKNSNRSSPAELPLESLQWLSLSQHHSLVSSSAAEETEDRQKFYSGGTLRTDAEEVVNVVKTGVERQFKATVERTHPSVSKQQGISHSESRKGISTAAGHLECDERADGMSCSVAGSTSTNDDFLQTTPGEISKDASGDNLEYAPMEMNSWSSGSASHLGLSIGEPQFNFEEVRSYVSDSSDSCYSSMAANGAPRAYSFGASHIVHQQPRRSGRKLMQPEHGSPVPDSLRCSATLPQSEDVHHSNKPSPSTCASQEDARKRAFSLGSSKSWFQKPFRKLSRDFMSRAHRLSNTSQTSSTSSTGLSLVHSPNSCFLPATPQAYIATDPYPVSRVRSGSIGSGLSTPYSKRCVNNDPTGDHVPVDFGGGVLSLGKSGSGSLHSADSPSRSRTSSFGCGQRCYGLRDANDLVLHVTDAESEYVSALPSRRTYERCKEQHSSSVHVPSEFDEANDYVVRDPANAADFHIGSSLVSHEGQLSTNNYPDARSSQIFETIQESLSGRSSPAKETDSIDSNEEQETFDRMSRKFETSKSTGKKVNKEDNNDDNKLKQNVLDSGSDLEYVPVDNAKERKTVMRTLRMEASSDVNSSKTAASESSDNTPHQRIKLNPSGLSDISMPASTVGDAARKGSASESEDDERILDVALSEEISISDLIDEWIEVVLRKNIRGISEEFVALCSKTKPSRKDCSISLANKNSGLNRYQNVLCLNNSRVKLINHPSGNDYIHANYVGTPFSGRRFICTQAPLDSTIYDFWFMIVQEKIEYIIMLTNFVEKGYIKSALYFPFDVNKTGNYNGVIVKCLSCERRLDFECEVWERSLAVKFPGEKSVIVAHFHWTDWPDHGIPNSYSCPLYLLEMVRMSPSPIVLHCSAGIGRTGCLVLIEVVLEKLLCRQSCTEMDSILMKLRKQRAGLVQNDTVRIF
uniref:Protein-tyrosine-phosphatase n=1 Tax=Setaria digitata TaxID=48799 RepID=A0A915PG80_9BILA